MYIPVDKSLKFFLGDRFGERGMDFLLEKCGFCLTEGDLSITINMLFSEKLVLIAWLKNKMNAFDRGFLKRRCIIHEDDISA